MNLEDSGLSPQPVKEISLHAKQELQKIIISKKRGNYQWGWKDPRTCLFLPVYRELLPGAKYLFIIRDYSSSVSSLINRIYKRAEKKYLTRSRFSAYLWKSGRNKLRKWRLYKKFATAYLKVWIAYNENILNAILSLPDTDYLLVDHTAVYKNDQSIFWHLKNRWHFSLNHIPFKNVFKEHLMNKPEDISAYINNKPLLNKARELEDTLRKFGIKDYPGIIASIGEDRAC